MGDCDVMTIPSISHLHPKKRNMACCFRVFAKSKTSFQLRKGLFLWRFAHQPYSPKCCCEARLCTLNALSLSEHQLPASYFKFSHLSTDPHNTSVVQALITGGR